MSDPNAASPASRASGPDLKALVAPSSIAIVGASDRPGSIGSAVLTSLSRLCFRGNAWAVHPKYKDVLGFPAVPALTDLPRSPDVVAFVIRGASIPDQLAAVAAVGAKSMVIYDGGFAEAGEAGSAMQRRIADFCADNNIALCGPNCMGILNPHARATSYKLPVVGVEQLRGNVGLISQSGSVTIGLLTDVRRYGFSAVISSGNEAVTDAADYLSYLIDDPNTEVIAMFLEAVRRPQRFLAELRRASDLGKPVVVLKVGQSERARHAVATHTGALAGEAAGFAAAMRNANAIQVSDIDEMSEVIAALQSPRKLQGQRFAITTLSGGHSELILDLAETEGINLPPVGAEAMDKIGAVVGHVTGDGNPIDAWGTGDTQKSFTFTVDLLANDPAFDAVVLCYDQSEAPMIQSQGTPVHLFAEASAKVDKPFYLLGMRSGVMKNASVELVRHSGAAVLTGARQGLSALHKVGEHHLRRQRLLLPSPAVDNPLAGERRSSINEYDSKRLLAKFGVPVPPEVLANSVDEALEGARRIGWPVVVKAVSDDVQHKTELGLVKLNIRTEAELVDAYNGMTTDFAAKAPNAKLRGVLVQPMIGRGVEVFAGLNRDPEWGLCLAFGLGGVFIEVIKDVSLRLLPLSRSDAAEMIAETKAAKVLEGVRGAPPADIAALADCLQAIARFGAACSDELLGCDVNPIKVLPQGEGCVALDALITLQTRN